MIRYIRHFFTRTFSIYVVVGGIGASIDFILFFSLYHLMGWEYWIAASVAFVLAATFSFTGFKFFVFQTNAHIHFEYLRFIVVASVGLTITEILLWIGIDLLHIVGWVVKIFALGSVLAWNFTANTFWTFRRRH